MRAIDILFEDGEALVIDKPAGLPLDPPRKGGPSLQDELPFLRLGFAREPQPVHRLDHDTSGCLLLARNPKALKRFSLAFVERRVAKRYLGLVAGPVAADEGTIDLALSKISSEKDGWRMIPARTHDVARNVRSIVRYQPCSERCDLVCTHARGDLRHVFIVRAIGAHRAFDQPCHRCGRDAISAHLQPRHIQRD